MDAIAVMSAIDIYRKDIKFWLMTFFSIPQLQEFYLVSINLEIQQRESKLLTKPFREIRHYLFSSRNG